MDNLQTVLLGEAISDACLEEGVERIFPEPPGSADIKRIKGVVALIMESSAPPLNLKDLRAEILAWSLTDTERRFSAVAITDLLADSILEIDINREVVYSPPSTQHYLDCLKMR